MQESTQEAKNVYTPVQGYLTKDDVAKMLGVTRRALEGWMAKGIVPYFKLGKLVRFHEPDIHAHLRKFRVERSTVFLPKRRSAKLAQAASSLELKDH